MKKFVCTSSHIDYLPFKKLATRCKPAVRSYSLTTEMGVLQTASLKSFYAYVNRTLFPKPNLGPLYSHIDPDTLLHLDTNKANTFNNYFHSVFTLDNGTLPNFPLHAY